AEIFLCREEIIHQIVCTEEAYSFPEAACSNCLVVVNETGEMELPEIIFEQGLMLHGTLPFLPGLLQQAGVSGQINRLIADGIKLRSRLRGREAQEALLVGLLGANSVRHHLDGH